MNKKHESLEAVCTHTHTNDLRKEKSWEEIDQMDKWDLLELAAGYAD